MHFSLLLAFVQIVAASTVLQLNGTSFYSPEFVAGSVSIGKHSKLDNVLPATYLNKLPSSVNDLEKKLKEFLDGDDVISSSFLSTLILPVGAQLSNTIKQHLKSTGVEIFVSTSQGDLPPGPYFLHPSGSFTRVYRLYLDYNMAFVQGVIEGEDGTYIPSVAAVGESVNAAISIPVPSRHYYPKPSKKRPLSGLRLAVKDIFDLKGIKTGAGSRAYFVLYPPANGTASSLQRLVDLGAVIVGKVKTAQFAAGEVPTANYVDQLAPFNPRGDGYQSPSSSSCGTGAALASYDWLDLGTGTDTTGSLRGPSMANGLFGMRITNASLPLDGILPISASMDTPGLMARDAKLLRMAYTSWFKAKASYTSFPKRIVLPEEFWPSPNEASMPIFEKFIKDLSTLLDAKVEHVNTNKSFIQHTGNKEGLAAFTSSYPYVLIRDQWRAVGEPFIAEYQAQFGRFPFINPVPRSGLAIASQIDDVSYEEAVRHLKVYREWYTSQLVPSCEDALVLYPLGSGLELYRDDSLKSAASPSSSYVNTLQAALAGLPDFALPIGVRKYNSSVSLREEELPVSVGLIGGAGCDQMLLDLVVKLGEELDGFHTQVKTGRTMW
ncbi:amidase signature domain-containing protein [Thelonectria olida]|uniref:Amidase signature domain-containing protein n=1 Tax=Thelonectria olida TaxID=1576542 RepID=A0A9P8W259_9HYPO|nr:amidase signature domain-containing protein [Thelonectria olida]